MGSKESIDTIERFSGKVANYVKYRPRYPEELIWAFQDKMDLQKYHVLADVGSGSGISAELFVNNGNTVYAVEPNYEMRGAAEQFYANSDFSGQFVSVNGTAEKTGLPDDSVDFLIAGQALHWFNQDEFIVEIQRILKPTGWLGFFWNSRSLKAGFNMDYNHFLERFAVDFGKTNEKVFRQTRMHDIFSNLVKVRLQNRQQFDQKGLIGRFLSSSYAPDTDSAEYKPMLQALKTLFETHQRKGSVIFNYDVELYYGKFPRF